MTRWRASGTHLALSIAIIGGIALIAFMLWYPMGLYRVAGLDRLLLVMLGIDLTAGPLLTLILYRQGKRGLKFDLAVVALAQLAFLAYGLNTLRLARPVFLVGTPETFTVVFASEIDGKDLALAPNPEWRKLSWTGPRLVGTQMPADPERRRMIIEEFMAGGAGIERSPKYYEEFAKVAPALLRNAEPRSQIKDGPNSIDETSTSPESRYVPVVSRRGGGLMRVDASSGHPLETVR